MHTRKENYQKIPIQDYQIMVIKMVHIIPITKFRLCQISMALMN